MSNNSMQIIPDRTELKVLIIRKYGNQRNFAEAHNINYQSFRTFMRGRDDLTNINKKIIQIMKDEYPDSIPEDINGLDQVI